MSENYHGVSVRSETTMTDDLKAPERIWAWHHKDATLDARLWEAASPAPSYFPGKEYVDADRIADLEAALADMTRQRDAAMAGALRVRELAWEQLGERAWRAPSPLFGSFRVERYGDRLWQALWSVPGICDTFVEGDFATADDAKQAIQARILSALTPDPDRMLALTAAAYEDAAQHARCQFDDRGNSRAGHYSEMDWTDGYAAACGAAADRIRALTHTDALSRIEAQAEARGMRKAAEAISALPTPTQEGTIEGHEQAYRAVAALADRITALEAAIADMTQQRDAAMAGAVKVKPLVWVKHPSVDIWRADTAFGTYKVFGLGPTPSWDFDSFSDLNDKTSKSAESVTAAKAAAQADYNSRILSALTPDADRMLALIVAAEAQAEARGMRKAAELSQLNGDWVGRGEILALADATEAAAKGGV